MYGVSLLHELFRFYEDDRTVRHLELFTSTARFEFLRENETFYVLVAPGRLAVSENVKYRPAQLASNN